MLSTLVTGSGRAPQVRAPGEEEGWPAPRARWAEGLRRRGREALRLAPIRPASRGRTGVSRAGSLGARVASVGARCGASVALAKGAGPAARRRREGPPGSPGSPLWFPSCLPAPAAGLASRRARGGGRAAGGGGSHSEFPATVPASRKGTAARRGQDARRERLASRLQPAAGTEPAARGRAGLRQGAPRARRPGGPREAPPPPRVPRRRVLGRRERASERVQTSTHARAGESPNGRCSHTCKPAEGSPGRDPAEGSGSPGVARPEEDEGGSLRRGRGDRVLVFPRTAFVLISLLFRCSRCSDSYQGPSGHPAPCPGPPCAHGAYARQRECSVNVRY